MAEFESSITLRNTAETVCEFLLQPQNIQKISPPHTGLKFTKAPQCLSQGSQIEFAIVGFGQTQNLVHEITALEFPNRFVEEQIVGPLKQWKHEHRIETVEPGVVQVTDAIQFTPPGGLVGLLMTESRILETLNEGFEYRYSRMREFLELEA